MIWRMLPDVGHRALGMCTEGRKIANQECRILHQMQSPSIPKLEINHDWKSIEHVKQWYWYHSLYCSMKARDDPSNSIHVGIYVSLNVVNQGMFGNHLLSTFSQLDAFPMSSQVRNDNSSRFGKFIEVGVQLMGCYAIFHTIVIVEIPGLLLLHCLCWMVLQKLRHHRKPTNYKRHCICAFSQWWSDES